MSIEFGVWRFVNGMHYYIQLFLVSLHFSLVIEAVDLS